MEAVSRLLRRFETVERAVVSGVAEHGPYRLTDVHLIRAAADDVGQHPWPFRQFHVRDDIRDGTLVVA